MPDDKPLERQRRSRRVKAVRFSSTEFYEVCRAAKVHGIAPATWMREQLLLGARQTLSDRTAKPGGR